jgi:hypothetical protein
MLLRQQQEQSGGAQDTFDYLISEKCQAGDVILFDRKCETCAAGPWAALSCLLAKYFLTAENDSRRVVDVGRFDHVGLIVPGYVKSKADLYDPTNLLLLEATPHGIVARPLKERLEKSFSRSILLLPLCCPGERRNNSTDEKDSSDPSRINVVEKTREHVERELRQFRDRWVALGSGDGEKKSYYPWIHSTVAIGGALVYGLGFQSYSSGPVSPSAYLVLMGLLKASAAQNIDEKDNRAVKPEDFLRDHRMYEQESIRLRPGWRFLPPVPLKEVSRS